MDLMINTITKYRYLSIWVVEKNRYILDVVFIYRERLKEPVFGVLW